MWPCKHQVEHGHEWLCTSTTSTTTFAGCLVLIFPRVTCSLLSRVHPFVVLKPQEEERRRRGARSLKDSLSPNDRRALLDNRNARPRSAPSCSHHILTNRAQASHVADQIQALGYYSRHEYYSRRDRPSTDDDDDDDNALYKPWSVGSLVEDTTAARDRSALRHSLAHPLGVLHVTLELALASRVSAAATIDEH